MDISSKNQILPPLQYLQTAKNQAAKGNFVAAVEAYQKAAKCYEQSNEQEKRIDILLEVSHLYGTIGSSQAAENHCQQAFQLAKTHLSSNHILLAKANLSMGKIKNIYKSGLDNLAYLKEALRIYQLQPVEYSLDIANTYTNIGLACFHLREYEDMNRHLQKCLHIFYQLEEKGLLAEQKLYNTRIHSHTFIAIYYLSKQDHENAMVHIQLGLKLLQSLEGEGNTFEQIEIYYNFGNLYFLQQEWDSATRHYEQTIQLANEFYGKDNFKLTIYRHRLASAYIRQGNFQESLVQFQVCANIAQKVYGIKNEPAADCYFLISEIYFRQKKYSKALISLQQSLISLFPNFQDTDVYVTPKATIQITDASILIKTLRWKAQILFSLYQENTQNIQDLQAAYEVLLNLHQLVEQLLKAYPNDKGKLPSTALLKQVYLFSIRVALHLANTAENENLATTYRRKTFHFSEKYRGNLLLQKMRATAAKSSLSLPLDLLEKEQQLQRELAELNVQIQQAQSIGRKLDTLQISQWQAAYLDKYGEYERLTAQIEQEHPDYFQLKYQSQTVRISDLQKILPPRTALISYALLIEDFQHLFITTSNDFHALELSIPTNLAQKVEEFKDWIQAGIVDLFTEAATELYQILLQSIEKHLQNIDHLIFIPDGCLNYLPFECLLTPPKEAKPLENDSFFSLPYLIQSYQVSYHHSATLFHYDHQKRQNIGGKTRPLPNSFLGFAPVAFDAQTTSSNMGYIVKSAPAPSNSIPSTSNNLAIQPLKNFPKILKSSTSKSAALADLNETEREVKTVFQLFAAKGFEATALFYNQATKANLQKYLKGHKYVLLSTHGFVDEKNPAHSGLYLYENSTSKSVTNNLQNKTISNNFNSPETSILHTSEAYLLELDADLVVLSSCESGIGRLQQGEGMMALHRAFLEAGVSNIIYSLFKIPQDTTSLLTQYLFRYILEGEGYALALQKAKLDLIEKEEVEPRDWAGLVLLGK